MRDPDLIADSGFRVSLDFTAASVDALMTSIAGKIVDGGWTLESSGTLTGHPFYKLLSKQSTWWDDLNPPPASYKAKVKVLLHAFDNRYLRIKPFNFDESLTLTPGDPEITVTWIDALTTYRVRACNFQFETYVPSLTSHFLGPLAAVVSAMHTPIFLQRDFGLVECIAAFSADSLRTGFEVIGNQQFFAVKDQTGVYSWSGNSNDAGAGRLIAPTLGRNAGITNQSARVGAYNLDDDPNTLDDDKLYGILAPPLMAWSNVNGTTPPLLDDAWFWDCLLSTQVVNGDATIGSFKNFTKGNIGSAFKNSGTLLFAY